jgi:murein DD-endopeptidase MepM/ murein hydrolase activator NlpD
MSLVRLGLALVLAVPALLARDRSHAVVSWTPDRPAQGDLFFVQVRADPGPAPSGVTGTAAREELRFERTMDGSFVSLAAVPVDIESSLELTVRVTHADGTEELLRPSVPLELRSFGHEELSVAPALGGQLSPERQARLDRDRAMAAEVSRQALATERMWTGAFAFPRDDHVTSGFGNGRIFNGEVSSRHLGLDLAGQPGDTVVAVARGVVALVEEFLLAGNIVYLNHGGGLLSGYFHLSEQLVRVGDIVEPGTPIGLVGATGRVTGPHLHWVVRYGSTSVDPQSLLRLASETWIIN